MLERADRIGGDRQGTQHELADQAAERRQGTTDQNDDEELEREERAERRRVSDAREMHGESPREARDEPRPAERQRPQADDRHVQRGGRGLTLARSAELQADRRSCQGGVGEHREQCEQERELVVLGR